MSECLSTLPRKNYDNMVYIGFHIAHANILIYCAVSRPYSNTYEMEQDLVAKFNAVVKPEDTVWHLGDFAMNEAVVPKVLSRLYGHHKLVSGNHDKCHPKHKKWEAAKKRYLSYGFEEVVVSAEVHPFKLCHVPYDDTRYPLHVLKDEGSWLICGHVHGAWKIKGKMINVGVDVWDMAPVSLETLIAIKESAT